MTGAALKLDIASDVMCPWCYIGKRRLEKAIRLTEVPLDVRWRPYQLDPTLPTGGKPRHQYLAEKFGSLEQARARYRNIEAAGAEEAIPFAFDRIQVSPNTLDAHRLIRWAADGDAQMQNRIVEALFRAYFVEGRHIGDRAVLIAIAEEGGMDGALVRELLERGADRDLVEQEIALAQQMGVTGVPTFIIADRFAVVGAQPAPHLAQAFAMAAGQGASENRSTE
jgi:predicted DsbA family dithiol-disulfide isomerase